MNYIEIFLFAFHKLNNFLGSARGDLFTATLEVFLFFFSTYMVFSEWKKNNGIDLRYLFYGFGLLTLSALVKVAFLWTHVFSYSTYPICIMSIAKGLEIIALLVIGLYFIRLHKITIAYLFIVVPLIFLSLCVMYYSQLISMIMQETILVIIVFVLLIYSIKKHYWLSSNVAVSFAIYSFSPIIKLYNLIIHGGSDSYLKIVSNPFPFIAIMFLMRLVYLRLIDKAHLKHRLDMTKKKYLKEKSLRELKDDFVSTVTHELKTPLTSMGLYLDMLKSSKFGKMNKKQKNAIQRVHSETSRLSNLIGDMLDIMKLDKNKIKLKIIETDLYEIVCDDIALNMAKNKKIKYKCKIPKNFIVKIDKEKFKQIFINLFSNALKYNKENGKITVDAEKYEDGWVFIIKDSGRGMTKEELPHIFERFYRIEGHLNHDVSGTGLGLSIVKHLVILHKGSIKVGSTLGKGTEFRLFFPKDIE